MSKNLLFRIFLTVIVLGIMLVMVSTVAHAQDGEPQVFTKDIGPCLNAGGYPAILDSDTIVAPNSLIFWGWNDMIYLIKTWDAGTQVCILGGSTVMGYHLSPLEDPTNVWWTQWRSW